MDRHFTKSLARGLMGSKEKWVSGQGATDKFITDFMPRYISSTTLFTTLQYSLQYISRAVRAGLRYMTEGGIEGVPNSEAGNYSVSTEHTKYSQSVLFNTALLLARCL